MKLNLGFQSGMSLLLGLVSPRIGEVEYEDWQDEETSRLRWDDRQIKSDASSYLVFFLGIGLCFCIFLGCLVHSQSAMTMAAKSEETLQTSRDEFRLTQTAHQNMGKLLVTSGHIEFLR